MAGVLNILLTIAFFGGIVWFGRSLPFPITLVAAVVLGEIVLVQAAFEEGAEFGLWAVILLAGVVGCWVPMVLHRRAGRQFAIDHGMTFQARDDGVADALGLTDLSYGSRYHARNVIEGDWHGRHVTICDFTQITEGRGASARRIAVVALASGCGGKSLEVLPEWAGSRAVGTVFGDDISFESEDFNRAFTVRSSDRRFASNVITPAMMEFLLSMPRRERRLRDGDLFVATRRTAVDYHDVLTILLELEQLIGTVPEHVAPQVPKSRQPRQPRRPRRGRRRRH